MDTYDNKSKYTAVKTAIGDKLAFINMADEEATQAFRNQHENTDILMSACSFDAPGLSAQRTYPPLHSHSISGS